MCQHIEHVLCLVFPRSPPFFLRGERKTPGSTVEGDGEGVGGLFSELQARAGLEGEGERLQGVRRWCSATSTPGPKRGGGP